MKVRHQPGLARDQFHQRFVDLNAVQRREPQALEGREVTQQTLTQQTETALDTRNIDPGQHDLARAGGKLALDRLAHCFVRSRPARPTRAPDGAEGAAVIATGLDRDETPHPPAIARRNGEGCSEVAHFNRINLGHGAVRVG